MTNINPRQVITGRVRLTFPHLFEKYAASQGNEPKFSTTFLVPKSDVLTKQKIDAAIAAATNEGVSKSWNGVRPPNVPNPVHDGDGVRPSDGQPFPAECKGHWVITASSKQQPQVVDLGLNPVMIQSEIYSGVYARVSINFFAYNASGKKGIGCGLNNVQKLEDGEPLGGRTSATNDFGDAAPSSAPHGFTPPQQYVAAPQQYAAPVQPQYGQPVPPQYAPPAQPQYAPPVQQYTPLAQPQIDPITGLPIVPPMGY